MTNERFAQNLEKWTPLNQEAAKKISALKNEKVFFCQSENGEPNLKNCTTDTVQYYHSVTSPTREAQQWFLPLDLKNVSVLYIYGIGLGYYYDILKDWLKEDRKRYAIFLEDNLEVIRCFLETERASDFLNNSQVRLFYFDWETSFFSFQFVTSFFSLFSFKTSALKFYEISEPKHIVEFRARIDFFHDLRVGTAAEFIGLGASGFIPNFYRNLIELPKSKFEAKLRGQFKNIPAIICGAGPSLEKNIHILKDLQDKALIMAGGTAMNVLNGAGIIPHFGLGIDPNPAHYNRLISNTAFETPFFYRQRMYAPAVKMIHGERIFIAGAGGYRLPGWFEEKLGIPKATDIEEGHNVVNFNLSIAKELGCNPILIVGVDLAYSNNLSYAPGLIRHAIHDPKEAFLTKYSHEELLIKNDIYGVPVNTLWKWVNESLWFSQFASKNPEVNLLNCTEGGIGFARVPNMKLSEAAEKFLTQSYDFPSLLHGEIQNSTLPVDLTLPKILDNIQVIARSLLHCESYGSTIILELGKLFQKTQEDQTVSEVYHTPRIQEYINKLENEEGYKYLLKDYNERFIELFYPMVHYFDSDPAFNTPKEIRMKRIAFDINLYNFLIKVARYNINVLGPLLKSVAEEEKRGPPPPSKKALSLREMLKNDQEKAQKKEHYSFENNELTLIDPELYLNYKKQCLCEEKKTFYPNGAIKSILYTHEGKFHGPALFYAENGQVLSQGWYIEGRMEGKNKLYYPTGELYAIKRYKNGRYEGRQEYYYRNSLPKSLLMYRNHLMEGEWLLFHENGKVKREMHFKEGKKEGVEKMWNTEGMLVLEAYYKNNIPIGTAREWYANGMLAKQIVYEENSEKYEIKLWKENGTLVGLNETEGKNYFDMITNYSKSLNISLQNMYKTLVNIAPTLPQDQTEASTIEQDLIALKQEMEKLNAFNQKILEMGGYEGTSPKEALWKTPEVEKMLRAQLEGMNKRLSEVALETHESLKDLFKKLEPESKESNNKDTQPPHDNKKN